MKNVTNFQSAREAAQRILRRLATIKQLSASAPGLVRVAVDGRGDTIAFWHDGHAVEFNLSDAQRTLEQIRRAYPDALRSRSGNFIHVELPILR